MARRELVTVDFETEAIAPRPDYPPKPVGVAIKVGAKKARYLAWGHPVGNNTTKEKAVQILQSFWRGDYDLLFHNAKFDLDVAEVHCGLRLPGWDRVHDTLFQLFLDDPHASSLSLKPAAERILGMVPEERDAVRDWLVEHKLVTKASSKWGAHIAKAPGDLVGKYAIGDVERTYKLHAKLYPQLTEAGMLPAYNRERQLMPILLRNEREGIRVDLKALQRDYAEYLAAQRRADLWLRKRLKAPNLNIDSAEELAEALSRAGVVTEWVTTKDGHRSVAKDNLTPDKFNDKRVAQAFAYRQKADTCLSTFYEPWIRMAEANDGYIFTSWNQVRQSHGDDSMGGARTGRLTCSPNFQNIPKNWADKNDGYEHPDFLDLPELPLMRKYVLPDEGGTFGHRDYSQQELRILAHYEDDKLCAAYRENPWLDVHTFVQREIHAILGIVFDRRPVKTLNFGTIYGMGIKRLAARIGSDAETARRLRGAQRAAIPGLAALERDIKWKGAQGDFIRTWGGRRYFTEPPKTIDGMPRTFEYKLLNYLIQGSAADCTKEAIIRYDAVRKDGRFLVTVHDEMNISAPKAAVRGELLILREAMESVEFDVPMLSDAKIGPSWGALKPITEEERKAA